MDYSESQIKTILDLKPTDTPDHVYIAEVLKRHRKTKADLAKLSQKRKELAALQEKMLSDINKEEARIRLECKHELTNNHFGYEFSYTECAICGMVME